LTQKGWRWAGAIFLAGAALLAWFGAEMAGPGTGLRFMVIYWGLFVLLILLALYMALLDLKYIRLQYRLAERQLFEQTLGNPAFRKALKTAESDKEPGEKAGETPKKP